MYKNFIKFKHMNFEIIMQTDEHIYRHTDLLRAILRTLYKGKIKNLLMQLYKSVSDLEPLL